MLKIPHVCFLALALGGPLEGCKKGELAQDRPEKEPPQTGDTGTTAPDPGCTVDADNALRVTCRHERQQPGPISVRWSAPDEPARVIEGDAQQLDAIIRIWDLLSETTYAWEILEDGEVVLSGELTTPEVPVAFRIGAAVDVDGPTSVDRVLFSMGCSEGPTLFVMDGQNRLRWYQPTGTPGLVTGFDWTDRGTVAALAGRARMVEWRPDGTVLLDVRRGKDYERVMHHSVVGRQGRLIGLDAEAVAYPDGNEYVVDGISEITADGNIRLWNIASALDPQQVQSENDPFYWGQLFPDATDFAHANSIELWDGDWLMSFKHLGVVTRIDADDGHIVWWVAGTSTPPDLFDGPKLMLGSSVGLDPSFQHQHHANPSPWGTLLLVDNGQNDASTRVLELGIDETLQRADVVRAWDLGETCPVQSSAFGLPDGTVLASCARTRQLFELDQRGSIRRKVSLSCEMGAGMSFTRAQPLLSGWR